MGLATYDKCLPQPGDLLSHRPRRYEQAVDEIAISQLWGDDEVAIAGEVVDVRTRRLGGRRRRGLVGLVAEGTPDA